jgi:hypothetical protein
MADFDPTSPAAKALFRHKVKVQLLEQYPNLSEDDVEAFLNHMEEEGLRLRALTADE